MAAEKKDFFENWEVLIGSVVRPQFEKFFFSSMDRLKLADPELWMAVTWMYREKPSSYGQFRAMLLGTASATERLLDWFGEQAGIFGQLVDKVGVAWLEDIDGYLEKYSKSQSKDVYKGYLGPKDVDLKAIAGRAKTHLKKWSVEYIHRLPTLLDFRSEGLFGGDGWLFGQTLNIQPEETFQRFKRWYEGLDDRTRTRFFFILRAVNNGGEFACFLNKTEEDMTFFVNMQYEAKKRRIIDPEFRAEVGAIYNATVRTGAQAIANGIEESNRLRSETDEANDPLGTTFQAHWAVMPIAIGLVLVSLATFPWGQSSSWDQINWQGFNWQECGKLLKSMPWMQIALLVGGVILYFSPHLIRFRLANTTRRVPEVRARVIS